MALPITHRIDAKIVYISLQDDVWNFEKIARDKRWIAWSAARSADEAASEASRSADEAASEASLLEPDDEYDAAFDEPCPWPTEVDHPFRRYVTGLSRFDVATVQAYMLKGVKPVEFHLRRLRLRHWMQVAHLNELGSFAEARVLAISLALVEVKGATVDLKRRKATDPLTDQTVDRIRSLFGDTEFGNLGNACIAASRELDPDEKKR